MALCEGNPPVTGGFPSQRPDAGLWCSLWSAPEQTVDQTIETPVIWDAIALIMTSLHGFGISETVIIFFTATRQLPGQPVTKNWSNWHFRTRPISSVPLISFFFFGRKLKHCSYIEHHIHIWQAVEYEYNSKNVIYAFVNAHLSITENLARECLITPSPACRCAI